MRWKVTEILEFLLKVSLNIYKYGFSNNSDIQAKNVKKNKDGIIFDVEIKSLISKYKHSKDFVWAQEEPRNMGAWSYLLLHLPEAKIMRVASRRMYGSPAAGSSTRFNKRHKEVIDYVFDKTKDNFTRKIKK